ncbi:MAG: TlpA disulfide reductase family protein [Candidatus Aminicenantes bacterium]|nr:TlpA disulfide reductase family protein [Candidatus Aminicenantes bacterium]
MKTKKTSILIAALFLTTSVFCLAQAGEEPPDFSAKDVSGRSVKLSELKGKVVLLDFWATWCPPCRVEIPNLLGIFRNFKDKDFVMISISLDRDLQAARLFVKDKKMDWLQIIDLETGQAIAALYQVEYIPSTFIINRRGKIEASHLLGGELKNKIAALLK